MIVVISSQIVAFLFVKIKKLSLMLSCHYTRFFFFMCHIIYVNSTTTAILQNCSNLLILIVGCAITGSVVYFRTYLQLTMLGLSKNDYNYEINQQDATIQVNLLILVSCTGHTVAQLVEVLRYKPEGSGFDSLQCHWNFSLT